MHPKKITLHCTATKNGHPCPANKIRHWHLKRGWNDIGYHLVIQPDGEVERGRPFNRIGAHVSGFNIDNIGIALVGLDRFSVDQFEALRHQIKGIQWAYEIPDWEIYGHNDFTDMKTCPNMDSRRIVYWYATGNYKAIEDYLLNRKYVFS